MIIRAEMEVLYLERRYRVVFDAVKQEVEVSGLQGSLTYPMCSVSEANAEQRVRAFKDHFENLD